jgi:hypothetical protein
MALADVDSTAADGRNIDSAADRVGWDVIVAIACAYLDAESVPRMDVARVPNQRWKRRMMVVRVLMQPLPPVPPMQLGGVNQRRKWKKNQGWAWRKRWRYL